MKRIVVIGAGFSGLWSALAAARKLDELNEPAERAEVVIVNPQPYHSVRVRNYEQPLDASLVPLDSVLDSADVRRVQAKATGIDSARRRIHRMPAAWPHRSNTTDTTA